MFTSLSRCESKCSGITLVCISFVDIKAGLIKIHYLKKNVLPFGVLVCSPKKNCTDLKEDKKPALNDD